MFSQKLENVRKMTPLIHNITNYVTVNDCANVLLACGGSPIMSDDIDDVYDIATICGGLNINIGALNKNTIPSMFMAGKRANELNHPVILDPVGVGASKLRTQTAYKLLDEVKFSVIRGNISEIKALVFGSGSTKGVDADVADEVNSENLETTIQFAKEFSKKTGAVIAITGAMDIVADYKYAYVIKNGHTMMSKITGTGCMLTAMIAAYIVAEKSVGNDMLEAVAAATCAMGLCGERAHSRLTKRDGNATYRNYIIDEIYNLDGKTLDEGAKYEMQ